jgi:outer membrane biosynthesis protein TonB
MQALYEKEASLKYLIFVLAVLVTSGCANKTHQVNEPASKYVERVVNQISSNAKPVSQLPASEYIKGSIWIATTIYSDGTLRDIRVTKSEGKSSLAEGAINIIRKSAPFEHFPKYMAESRDVLQILQEFQFSSNETLYLK